MIANLKSVGLCQSFLLRQLAAIKHHSLKKASYQFIYFPPVSGWKWLDCFFHDGLWVAQLLAGLASSKVANFWHHILWTKLKQSNCVQNYHAGKITVKSASAKIFNWIRFHSPCSDSTLLQANLQQRWMLVWNWKDCLKFSHGDTLCLGGSRQAFYQNYLPHVFWFDVFLHNLRGSSCWAV